MTAPTPCRSVLLSCIILGFLAVSSHGIITDPMPLKSIVDDSDQIALVTVQSIDPARPTLVLDVTSDLKGTLTPARIPIFLKGDAKGSPSQVLDRVAAGSQMIFFITQEVDQHIGLLYSEGSWYQLIGYPNEGGARWMFTHGEPYLRRTFKGPTKELHDAIAAYFKDQTELPAENPQETPGLGPTLSIAAESPAKSPAADPAATSATPPIAATPGPVDPTTSATITTPPATPPISEPATSYVWLIAIIAAAVLIVVAWLLLRHKR